MAAVTLDKRRCAAKPERRKRRLRGRREPGKGKLRSPGEKPPGRRQGPVARAASGISAKTGAAADAAGHL